jgi:hypothetical protein
MIAKIGRKISRNFRNFSFAIYTIYIGFLYGKKVCTLCMSFTFLQLLLFREKAAGRPAARKHAEND